MGLYDQTARRAMLLEPTSVIDRLLRWEKVRLRFSGWRDSRTTPRPTETERTADKIAVLGDSARPKRLWALIFEFQAKVDREKLDVTLVEVARVRTELRHGKMAKRKYRVLAGFVYLRDQGRKNVLNMTLPSGLGTRHSVACWNVADDDAFEAMYELESAAGQTFWGLMFWVALMKNGGDAEVIRRWLALLKRHPEPIQVELVEIALIFAELAGCFSQWESEMEQMMTESAIVNRWLAQGQKRGRLDASREYVIELLNVRFPGQVTDELRNVIQKEESETLLRGWLGKAATVGSVADFIRDLR